MNREERPETQGEEHMSIEAMKLALEYLESEVPFYECEGNDPPTGMTESIKALRSAIEQAEEQRPHYTWQYAKDYIASRQAEQEPVAWMYEFGTDCGDAVHEIRWYSNVHWKKPSGLVRNVVPLYTAPPQREWQGLTDDEIWNTYKNLWMFHPAEEPRLGGDILKFARAIEAKLKDKNDC